MSINPEYLTHDASGRWYFYPPKEIAADHHHVRLRCELNTIDDTFDVDFKDGGVIVRHSYRSIYGNISGITPEMSPALRARVIEHAEDVLLEGEDD